jgi:hypothetical protein
MQHQSHRPIAFVLTTGNPVAHASSTTTGISFVGRGEQEQMAAAKRGGDLKRRLNAKVRQRLEA